MIDMVWRYKYYIAIIEACDKIINELGTGAESYYTRQKRTKAFQQLLDFQIAFHSGD